MMADMHVYKGIAKCMKLLKEKGIGKDNENQHQRYMFRGIDDAYNALVGCLVESEIIVLPCYSGHVVAERGQTKDGKAITGATVNGQFRIVSVVDGSETSVTFPGEAHDTADKSTNKAMSAAYKYFVFQTFCVPTEGDGASKDADFSTHEVAKPTAKTVSLKERINATKSVDELQALLPLIEKETEAVKKDLRPLFSSKLGSFK